MMKYEKYYDWSYKPRLAPRFYAIIALSLAIYWILIGTAGVCTEKVLQLLPSPDGRWTAIVDQHTCDIGPFMSSIVVGISVSPRSTPDWEINLMGVDTGGHVSERPTISWSATDTLQATVPSRSYLKILNTRFGEGKLEINELPDSTPQTPKSTSSTFNQPIHASSE